MGDTVKDRIAQSRRLLSVVVGRDVSASELSEMAGLAVQTYASWENGNRHPSRDNLAKIASLFREYGMSYITEAWLSYGEGDGPPPLGAVPPKRNPRPTSSKKVAEEKPPKRKRG